MAWAVLPWINWIFPPEDFSLVQGFVSSCQNSVTRLNLGASFWHFLGYWEECDSLGILLSVREKENVLLLFWDDSKPVFFL